MALWLSFGQFFARKLEMCVFDFVFVFVFVFCIYIFEFVFLYLYICDLMIRMMMRIWFVDEAASVFEGPLLLDRDRTLGHAAALCQH